MNALKILLLVGGVALCIWTGKEVLLACKASTTPQTLTCAELAASGPGENAHIILTKFMACTNSFIRAGKTVGQKGPWQRVYVPAVESTVDNAYTMIQMSEAGSRQGFKGVKVVLELDDVKDDLDLQARLNRNALQGIVVNCAASLNSKEKAALKESYSDADLERCHILQVGRKPAGISVFAAFGAGVVLVVASLLWMIIPAVRRRQAPPAAPGAAAPPIPG